MSTFDFSVSSASRVSSMKMNNSRIYTAGFKSKQHKHCTCEAKVESVASLILLYLAQHRVFLQMSFEAGISLLEFKLDRSQRFNRFELYLADL